MNIKCIMVELLEECYDVVKYEWLEDADNEACVFIREGNKSY